MNHNDAHSSEPNRNPSWITSNYPTEKTNRRKGGGNLRREDRRIRERRRGQLDLIGPNRLPRLPRAA